MRSLAYLKVMVEMMLVTVDCTKHQALCCSSGKWYQCCPPKVSQDENLVSLSYLECQQDPLPSVQHDTKGSNVQKSKNYLPFTVTHPKWKSSKARGVVDKFIQRLSHRRSLAWEDPEQPMLFIPGRVLHLEEPDQYRIKK